MSGANRRKKYVRKACKRCVVAKRSCSDVRPCERCCRLGKSAECIEDANASGIPINEGFEYIYDGAFTADDSTPYDDPHVHSPPDDKNLVLLQSRTRGKKRSVRNDLQETPWEKPARESKKSSKHVFLPIHTNNSDTKTDCFPSESGYHSFNEYSFLSRGGTDADETESSESAVSSDPLKVSRKIKEAAFMLASSKLSASADSHGFYEEPDMLQGDIPYSDPRRNYGRPLHTSTQYNSHQNVDLLDSQPEDDSNQLTSHDYASDSADVELSELNENWDAAENVTDVQSDVRNVPESPPPLSNGVMEGLANRTELPSPNCDNSSVPRIKRVSSHKSGPKLRFAPRTTVPAGLEKLDLWVLCTYLSSEVSRLHSRLSKAEIRCAVAERELINAAVAHVKLALTGQLIPSSEEESPVDNLSRLLSTVREPMSEHTMFSTKRQDSDLAIPDSVETAQAGSTPNSDCHDPQVGCSLSAESVVPSAESKSEMVIILPPAVADASQQYPPFGAEFQRPDIATTGGALHVSSDSSLHYQSSEVPINSDVSSVSFGVEESSKSLKSQVHDSEQTLIMNNSVTEIPITVSETMDVPPNEDIPVDVALPVHHRQLQALESVRAFYERLWIDAESRAEEEKKEKLALLDMVYAFGMRTEPDLLDVSIVKAKKLREKIDSTSLSNTSFESYRKESVDSISTEAAVNPTPNTLTVEERSDQVVSVPPVVSNKDVSVSIHQPEIILSPNEAVDNLYHRAHVKLKQQEQFSRNLGFRSARFNYGRGLELFRIVTGRDPHTSIKSSSSLPSPTNVSSSVPIPNSSSTK